MKKEEWENFNCEEIELLTKYVNRRTKVLLRCKKCGYQYYKRPDNENINCPICTGGKFFNSESFQQYLNIVDDTYQIISEYKTGNDDILLFHQKCGNYIKIKPRYFISGTRCQYCKEKRNILAKDIVNYSDEVRKMFNNGYQVISSEYINNTTNIEYLHLSCKNTFVMTPTNFKKAVSPCPYCRKLSYGETQIAEYCKAHNMLTIPQKHFKEIQELSFDFYLPEKNVLIEYDGIQHFEKTSFGCKSNEKIEQNFQHQQMNDKRKNEFCKEKNIPLLRINYKQKNEIYNILDKFLN